MTTDREAQEHAVTGALERLARVKRLRLEARSRDGSILAEPVRFAINGRQVLVRVAKTSVIERLEDRPAVNVVPCARRGTPHFERPLLCRARIIPERDDAPARTAIRSRYRLWRLISRFSLKEARYAELTPFTQPTPVGGEHEPPATPPREKT